MNKLPLALKMHINELVKYFKNNIADKAKPRVIVGRKATPVCPAFAVAASRRQAKRRSASKPKRLPTLHTAGNPW
jgi:hypothetical protein